MAYPQGEPCVDFNNIYTEGSFTPETMVQYIKDNYTPINKNSMRNSIGVQLSLIENWVNKTYAGRANDPILSGFFENLSTDLFTTELLETNLLQTNLTRTLVLGPDNNDTIAFEGGLCSVRYGQTSRSTHVYMASPLDSEFIDVPIGTHLFIVPDVNTTYAEVFFHYGRNKEFSISYGQDGKGGVLHFIMSPIMSGKTWMAVNHFGGEQYSKVGHLTASGNVTLKANNTYGIVDGNLQIIEQDKWTNLEAGSGIFYKDLDCSGTLSVSGAANLPQTITLGANTFTYKTGTFTMQAYAWTGDTLLSTNSPSFDGIDCTYTIIGNVVTIKIPKTTGLIYLGTISDYVYVSGFPVEIRPITTVSAQIAIYDGIDRWNGWLTKYADDKWFIANIDGSRHWFPNSSCNSTSFSLGGESTNYANQNITYSLD